MSRAMFAIATALGAATPALAQTAGPPPFTIEARWVINGTAGTNAANPATTVVLTLQARAIFTGAFAADTSGTRYGNFGIFALGFGPVGPTAPSTITRTNFGISTTLERGNWGTFISTGDTSADPPIDPVTFGPLRGAAPGIFNPSGNAGSGSFRRGFRFFGTNVSAFELNHPTLNTPASLPNGRFDGPGNLTDFNLLRDDFQSNPIQERNLVNGPNSAEPGTPLWYDVYRVAINSSSGLYFNTGPGTNQLTFNGYFRAAYMSTLVGPKWTMNSTDSVFTSASISFIPGPTSAAAFVFASSIVLQRRRS